jgi:hypothetical protein
MITNNIWRRNMLQRNLQNLYPNLSPWSFRKKPSQFALSKIQMKIVNSTYLIVTFKKISALTILRKYSKLLPKYSNEPALHKLGVQENKVLNKTRQLFWNKFIFQLKRKGLYWAKKKFTCFYFVIALSFRWRTYPYFSCVKW